MNQVSSSASSKSVVLPIQRSRNATASSTLYPLHQARALLRQLRPGSTSAPTNLVDAFRVDTFRSDPTVTNSYTSAAVAFNRRNHNLVQILDEALSVLQDERQCSIDLEEPFNCTPPRNDDSNNNNNSPRRQ